MTKRKHLELIREMKLRAVDHIRDYIESQKDSWQKIPYLALLAYKSSRIYVGHTDPCKIAYTKGLWKIQERVYINCEDGEIVNHLNKKLSYNASLILLEIGIEEFNAQKIIKKLKKQVNLSNDKVFTVDEYADPKKFRKAMIKKYGLHKNFYKKKK